MHGRFTALAATLVLGAASASAAMLYGVAAYAPFTSQSLYAIDPGTGAATLIGNTGVDQINGIAWDAAAGVLYGYTTAAELCTLNLGTGAATLVADAAATLPEGDIAITGSTLWAVAGDAFGVVNRTNGVFDPLGSIGGAATDVSGLAIAANGGVYGYAKNGSLEDTVVTINPASGAGTLLGATGINSAGAVGGLTVSFADGTLFLTDGGALYTVNPNSGAAALVGAHGVTGMSGLAFVPEPSSLVLLSLAALGLVRRRAAF